MGRSEKPLSGVLSRPSAATGSDERTVCLVFFVWFTVGYL